MSARRVLFAFVTALLVLSCGTQRRVPRQGDATLADSLYYFDSVRVFPEDSLSAAVRFGKANHQIAIFILSSGEEVLLTEGEE